MIRTDLFDRSSSASFDVAQEGDRVAGGKWSDEMIAAFVNALKIIKPGDSPPKALSEKEAKAVENKVSRALCLSA